MDMPFIKRMLVSASSRGRPNLLKKNTTVATKCFSPLFMYLGFYRAHFNVALKVISLTHRVVQGKRSILSTINSAALGLVLPRRGVSMLHPDTFLATFNVSSR